MMTQQHDIAINTVQMGVASPMRPNITKVIKAGANAKK